MNRTIYLVRHAQYDNPLEILVGRLPVKLSKAGISEAKKLQKYFLDKEISKIYSSAVARCKQTSEIISDERIPITFDTRLLETFSAFQGYWKYDWSHFFKYTDSLGGEIPQDIYDRVSNFWEEITQSFTKKDKNIIICSHGDPLYLLFVFLTNKAIPDTLQIYDVPIEDYQPKGSVRPVELEQTTSKVLPILDLFLGEDCQAEVKQFVSNFQKTIYSFDN